jgi:hypothetical protein
MNIGRYLRGEDQHTGTSRITKMKTVAYKNHNLATTSEGYKLWETWKKTNKPEDKKKLDDHLKDVDTKAKQLVERYK